MTAFRISLFCSAIPFTIACFGGAANAAEPKAACESLAKITTANSTIKATYITTASEFSNSTIQNIGETARPLFENVAAQPAEAPLPFCRVEITSTPVAGAEIKSEVWLPSPSKWNGRFLGAGNGGPAGVLSPGTLASGLAQGYATGHSDAGSHSREKLGANGTAIGMRFGAINKEWAINYSHRGYHTMAVVAKEVVQAFYEKKPKASLFMGCSGGGMEAMAEAQRYPEDYDGIISGDPAINFGKVSIWQGASYVATHREPDASIPSEMLPVIYKHYMEKCDALDGVKDGVINDPRLCKIDFTPMQCAKGKTDECFNARQIEALNRIYSPFRHPLTKAMIYPGFPIGAELTPGAKARVANEFAGSEINANTPGALVWVLPKGFKAADWMMFDFASDTDKYLADYAPYENANPDLKAFHAKGGKLIMFTGWADPNLNPYDIINYYENVKKTVGAKEAQGFARLFMVPGMYHCGAGPGPNSFGQSMERATKLDAQNNILAALDKWVSDGVAPERIIATKHVDDNSSKGVARTRPLCAYPNFARWSGQGSTDDAANFSCVSK